LLPQPPSTLLIAPLKDSFYSIEPDTSKKGLTYVQVVDCCCTASTAMASIGSTFDSQASTATTLREEGNTLYKSGKVADGIHNSYPTQHQAETDQNSAQRAENI
jgi:hypothetical protein